MRKKTSQNIARFPSLADCLDSAELVCCVFFSGYDTHTYTHMSLLASKMMMMSVTSRKRTDWTDVIKT